MFGAAIGAAASLAAGALAAHQSAQNASAFRDYGYQMAALNYDAQKEFAQNGIRWRVADAKAAGLHPLAALGASPLGFSPSFGAGGSAFAGSSDWSDTANALGNLGQNIDRAIEAKQTESERVANAEYTAKARQLDLENKQLQNDNLRQHIVDNALASVQALKTQAGQPPAMQQVLGGKAGSSGEGVLGQAQSYPNGLTVNKPAEVTSSMPGKSFIEAGRLADTKPVDTAGNGVSYTPSKDTMDWYGDNWVASLEWLARNKLIPFASQFIPGYTDPRAPQLTPAQKRAGYNDHRLDIDGSYRPTRRWFKPRKGWSW